MLKLMGTKYLSSRSTFMKKTLIIISVCWLWACGGGGESSPTEPQEPVNQDTLVSAFFGLDNALPSILCTQPGNQLDGMPVNFKYPLDAATLSGSDFEVVDSLGNIHIPICARLAPANDNGENRTVLLLGEFGTAVTNPPVEVRVVGDLLTIDIISGESACSEIVNLNGISTTNVIPLADGPSLFFAQRIDGNLNECSSGTQTIQVAWDGGITPYISGDTEYDLFEYYVGYSDSSGVLIPHVPISIADVNDNDNFHQLCFSTSEEIIKISMMANTVEDPNQDPNLYSEIDVSYCTTLTIIEENLIEKEYEIYPNPTSDYIYINNNIELEIVVFDLLGKQVMREYITDKFDISCLEKGTYILNLSDGINTSTHKIIKE